MKVVFFGTPEFSVGCLQRVAKEHTVLAVVTQPDRPRDRNRITASPVKVAALALGLPVLQPEKIRQESASVTCLGAEIGITAAYGQILPQALLDAFPFGIINVHASLLPKYRGSSPVQWAIINGERETGITIMQTAIGVDSGAILDSVKTPIGDDDTADGLFVRLAALAPDLLSETLKKIERGTATRTPQNEAEATHFPMLTKETGRLNFTKTAEQARNLVRGVRAFTVYNGAPIKVHKAATVVGRGEPGTVLHADGQNGLVVACGQDALRLCVVQTAGGRAMNDTDFLRGHSVAEGSKLC